MNDFDRAMYARADNVKANFNNFTNYLTEKGNEFNEWQKARSRNIKAKERAMSDAIYNWGQDVKNSLNSLGQSSQASIPQNLDSKGRKIGQELNNIVSNIVNSPEFQYAKDSGQFQEMARINADNHIGPARENVVYNLNRYKRSSPAGWDRGVAADALDDSVARYNEALKAYGNNTTGWPKNNEGEFRWQDYIRYRDYGAPYQYAYTTEGEKANAILSGGKYEPQKFEFQTQSGANLIRQMRELTSQYNKLEELQRVVWPQRNVLREQGKGDTKEARQYLNQWAEYDKEKTNILNALRQAKDNYYNLVNSYKK